MRLPVAALVALVLAGCAHSLIGDAGRETPAAARAGATTDDARAWEMQRPVAKDTAEAAHPGSKTSAAPATVLPAYAVRETAFSDFGMSVKTNFDVQWGGHVAWMVVTAIDAGSSAAQRRLGVGDRILAIDGRQITTFDRDAMLAALFHRKTGETARLLVLGPKEALPRFVMLVARRT
jgi:predicted metalloprotease with PDZ domain